MTTITQTSAMCWTLRHPITRTARRSSPTHRYAFCAGSFSMTPSARSTPSCSMSSRRLSRAEGGRSKGKRPASGPAWGPPQRKKGAFQNMLRTSKRKAPAQLRKEGAALWRDIASEYSIDDAAGLALLTTACECLDRMRAAQAAIKEDGELRPEPRYRAATRPLRQAGLRFGLEGTAHAN